METASKDRIPKDHTKGQAKQVLKATVIEIGTIVAKRDTLPEIAFKPKQEARSRAIAVDSKDTQQMRAEQHSQPEK